MEKNKFKVGDHVIIKNPDQEEKIIGKIEDIFNEGEEKIIRYNEYYFPEKTNCKIYK
jgi:hypothetical protein